MKLLMLGGSKAQLAGITKAKELGHEVIVCDYLEQSIGHKIADKSYLVSTFDMEAVLKVAKAENINGVMTLGTDQPVLTSAYVSELLKLPTMLNYNTALCVTNKIHMKKTFNEHNINTVDYIVYRKGYNDAALEELKGPIVVKPVDSQGQRGIFLLDESNLAIDYYNQVIEYSRTDEILVEQYYPHDEVTISGWVVNDITTVLTISDRVTFDNKEQIGICLSHEIPSIHMDRYGKELIDITKKIVKAFEIHNGPIYFQFLIGAKGIMVNEIACRIGGAFEASFMPVVTGFDILTAQINKELGLIADTDILKNFQVLNNDIHLSVQLFFVKSCKIAYIPKEKTVLSCEGVLECGFNIKIGDELGKIENATARGGYVIVTGKTREKLIKNIDELYKVLVVKDIDGNNHIIHTNYNKNNYVRKIIT